MKTEFYKISELKIGTDRLGLGNLKNLILFSELDSIGLQINIIYNDITDIKTRQPLKGGEIISLILTDMYDKTINKQFVLQSLTQIDKKGVENSLLSIKGISKDAFELSIQRDYKSYQGQKVSEIVSSISNKIKVTDTKIKVDVNSVGWTKNKFIQYLRPIAYSDKYKGNYLFYETLDEICFKPLNELLSKDGVNSYMLHNRNSHYRYNILAIEEKQNFNIIENSYNGLYDSSYVMYVPGTKSTIKKDVKIDSLSVKSLGMGRLYNDEVKGYQKSKLNAIPYHNNESTKSQTLNQTIFNTYNKRQEILINGDLDVQVGQLIYINQQSRYEQSSFDSESAGYWLIDKVAYHLNLNEFVCKLSIIKNAAHHYKISNKEIINSSVS